MAEPGSISRRSFLEGFFRKPNPEEPEEGGPSIGVIRAALDRVDRRTVLRMIAGATVVGVTGVAGLAEYIRKDMDERSERVEVMGQILRGERPGATVEMFDKEWSYQELVQVLSRISNPRLGPDQVEHVLDSLSYMIEVEDKFGNKFNTVPLLEELDMQFEPYQSFASSFGYGQVNPQTARSLAIQHKADMLRYGLLGDPEFDRLEDPNIGEPEIVEILDLMGDGNIVWAFLAFYEGYNEYGRARRYPYRINVVRENDPRSFNLAVAAYSATVASPRNAKLQTKLNEMMIMDSALRTTVQTRLEAEGRGLGRARLMAVDGDLGPTSLATLKTIAEVLDIPVSPVLDIDISEMEDPEEVTAARKVRMEAVYELLERLQPAWKDRMNLDRIGEPEAASRLRELVGNRYSTMVKTFLILKDMAGESDENTVRRLFFKYVDTSRPLFGYFRDPKDYSLKRDTTFLNFLNDPKLLKEYFPGVDHDQFRKRVVKMIPGALRFDDRYSGFVPTQYYAPKSFIEDPKNVVMRILLAHELDEASATRIQRETGQGVASADSK